MAEPPSTTDRELVRAAAQGVLDEPLSRDAPPWAWDYRQMARGTLEALNWLEGRRDTAPSSHRQARPEDEAGDGGAWRPSALQREILQTEDWGSGHIRPPTEDMHFHGAVWALLQWWRFPSDNPGGSLAITVPGLGPDTRLLGR